MLLDEAAEIEVESAPEVSVRALQPFLRKLIEAHVPARHVHGQLHPGLPVEPPPIERLPALHLAHVVAGALRLLEPLGIEHPLACQEDLRWIHRLDQVVGDPLADRLFHEPLFFALGDQDHRHR